MTTILAKSQIIDSHLRDKKNKGATGIEVHLLEQTLSAEQFDIPRYIEIIDKVGIEIHIVHLPIGQDYELDAINNKKQFIEIKKAFQLADHIGKHQGRTVRVIMHARGNLQQWKVLGVAENIRDGIDELLEQYKHTKLVVENSMILNIKNGDVAGDLNNTTHTIEIVNYFNDYIKGRPVGTVLDICHAIANERILETLVPNLGINLEKYFEWNKDLVEVIHLANCLNFGIGKDHAPSFETAEDLETLKRVINLINNINFDGLITIEIGEKDYTESINWEKTYKQLLTGNYGRIINL